MTYSLFIDDERIPGNRKPPAGDRWVIVRSVNDAIKYIERVGWPGFITFDHDLGENEPTGYDFAKWIVDRALDGKNLPSYFTFDIHSQNPVGAENIRSLLNNYLDWAKFKTVDNNSVL